MRNILSPDQDVAVNAGPLTIQMADCLLVQQHQV